MFIAWFAISVVHFGVPLFYFFGMRRNAYRKNYGLNPVRDFATEPTVTVVVPTYNEEGVIRRKLEDIARSDYPASKLEVIVVDGGSTDKTAEEAWRYFKASGIRGTVLEQSQRLGKSTDLNKGLKHATGELVCFSDAECEWDRDALRNCVKYFVDPQIGSVSGVHFEKGSRKALSQEVEGSYRSIYRMLRIAESKVHSTPVAEGELQLFRTSQMPGFDTTIGGDDTCAALCMVEKGFRSISAADVAFYEPTPPRLSVRFRQKVRRGQHVIQAFWKHRKLLVKRDSSFTRLIFPMEFFLYILNPLLFPFWLATTAVLAALSFQFALFIGVVALAIVLTPLSRVAITHITNNLTMLTALVREARGDKQLVWNKIEENRKDERAPEVPPVQTV